MPMARSIPARGVQAGLVLLAASLLLLAGCGDSGDAEAGESVPPARMFSTRIDNPYWPMTPGSRWVYREIDSEGSVQRVVVTVTHATRRIANGIEARVVHDVVSEDGAPVEVTDDWYAQDVDGNVWYLGERTAEYENGKVVTRAGSWEAGVDGAKPGIAMPAEPRPGLAYRQEYYAGEAEDKAKVLSVDEQAEVPFGHFTGVMLTKDLTPLEPKVLEYKLYARGVGPVLALDASGASGREELLSFVRDSPSSPGRGRAQPESLRLGEQGRRGK